jgi:outer membrane murein-binding lipoprotein Lpp
MRRVIVILAAIWLAGCSTMKPVSLSIPETKEYREIQGEIQKQQADLAVTGAVIEQGSKGIVEGLTELEKEISTASIDTGNDERASWLAQVQTLKGKAESLQTDAETLNRQLAQERDTNSRLNAEFNQYEIAQIKASAEKDTEIRDLQVENKKVKGQRNTLLGIVITAGIIIVLGIVLTVLRRLKIIPI